MSGLNQTPKTKLTSACIRAHLPPGKASGHPLSLQSLISVDTPLFHKPFPGLPGAPQLLPHPLVSSDPDLLRLSPTLTISISPLSSLLPPFVSSPIIPTSSFLAFMSRTAMDRHSLVQLLWSLGHLAAFFTDAHSLLPESPSSLGTL